MSTAAFIKGCKVRIEGIEFTLVRKIGPDDWQLEAQNTGELRRMTKAEMLAGVSGGGICFVIDEATIPRDGSARRKANAAKQFDLLSDGLKTVAKHRRRLVMTILKEFGSSRESESLRKRIATLWREVGETTSPPHPTTVWRWTQRFLASGKDIRSLVTGYHRSGNTKRRYPEVVETKVREAIDAEFLSMERGTYQDTLDLAIVKIREENNLRLENNQLPLPKLEYVRQMARQIPAFDREAARYGRQAAERKFRAVLGKTIADAALARVEIDHTRLDIFVVDDETFLPLGRPWLTVCIDARTRVILGFHLGFDPPSYSTVARALKHAIMPKLDLSATYPAVKGTWDAYGVMDGIVVDNGPEFHSESLEAACYSLGIDVQYCPRKQPWYKGIVERALGTMNRGVAHGIPGTTFSNILEKADYDAASRATVALRTLREVIHVWVVDYYHQRPHKGLGDTPAHAWKLETSGMDIRLPVKPQELDAVLGNIATRRLTHRGIEINSLFYNSADAKHISLKLGMDLSVTIRYDEENLGHIYLLDPDTNEYVLIPALDQTYAAGLTLYQHKVCRRFAKRELDGRTDVVALAEAKHTIQKLVDEDFSRKGKKTRVRPSRFRNGGKTGPRPPAPTSSPPAATANKLPVSSTGTNTTDAPPGCTTPAVPSSRVPRELPIERVQRIRPVTHAS